MKYILLVLSLNIGYSQNTIDYQGFNLATHNPAITDLHGSFRIDQLITDPEVKEYIFYEQASEQRYHYGNNILLKPDGIFASSYSAPCGNDCFTTSIGKYKRIDGNYICFYLDSIMRSGDCDGNTVINKDLGVFRIYRQQDKFLLIKSDGNPESDKNNLAYIDLLTKKQKEIYDYFNFQNFLEWKSAPALPEAEIVRRCMAENNIRDYEIVYSRIIAGTTIVLLKVDDQFRFVLYHHTDSENLNYALFDDSIIDSASELADQIDKQKSTTENITEPYDYSANPMGKNHIIVYSANNEINKIEYDIYNSLGHTKETFYVKDGVPFLVKIKSWSGAHFAYYIADMDKNRVIMHPVEKGWTFTGVKQMYYEVMKLLKRQ